MYISEWASLKENVFEKFKSAPYHSIEQDKN